MILCFPSVPVRSPRPLQVVQCVILFFCFLKGLGPEANLGKHSLLNMLQGSPIPGALASPLALIICPCSQTDLVLSLRTDWQVLFKSAFVLVDPRPTKMTESPPEWEKHGYRDCSVGKDACQPRLGTWVPFLEPTQCMENTDWLQTQYREKIDFLKNGGK